MGKTFLKLDKEISIIILSIVTMLFAFISAYGPINNLVSFLFVLIKSLIFIIVPLIVYLAEKNELTFKKIGGIYASYFIVNLFVTIIASISVVNGVTLKIWQILFDLVNLVILLSSLFILIEQVLDYAQIKNKVYSNTIMKIVYLVANFVSYPFLLFISKKINKQDENQ